MFSWVLKVNKNHCTVKETKVSSINSLLTINDVVTFANFNYEWFDISCARVRKLLNHINEAYFWALPFHELFIQSNYISIWLK